jgi:DNA polymerase III epsilon subunit-like protein
MASMEMIPAFEAEGASFDQEPSPETEATMEGFRQERAGILEKIMNRKTAEAAHEDAAELRYWESIFDDLSEQEQTAVLDNLKKELEALK